MVVFEKNNHNNEYIEVKNLYEKFEIILLKPKVHFLKTIRES